MYVKPPGEPEPRANLFHCGCWDQKQFLTYVLLRFDHASGGGHAYPP